MPLDQNGNWYPILAPKQIAVYNDYSRYILVSGPKKSGKTLVNLHRLVRHAMETPRARIGIFAKTVKNAKSGGVWNDITEIILPEWFQAGQTVYTTKKSDGTMGPKQDPNTRMNYLKIRNHCGGESEFQLHSIDNENEVEAIAKGTRFSCFYFPELSNFRQRLVFDITTDQLRMPGLDFNDHLWLSDTNPADDGEDSWIYSIWYKLPLKKERATHEEVLAKRLSLHEIMIPDNPFLGPEDREDLYARFSYDPDLYARYIEGRWVRASKDAIFAKHFMTDIHVLGKADSLDPAEWDVVIPGDECTGLISGWDLGDRFHSAHIAEVVEEARGRVYYIIDEVNHLDPESNVGISEFVEAFMSRYHRWTRIVTKGDEIKQRGFDWRHWSDKAALQNWRAGAESYDKNLVYKYSDGFVELMGAPKFPGSIAKRIQLLKILLFNQQVLISANCKETIAMLKSLRSGTGAKLIADGQKYRHVFDSLTYLLSAEEPALLQIDLEESLEKQEGGPVSVPL